MLISLDMSSEIPIYVQLRNQIVTGIGKGELKAGESPSVSPPDGPGCRDQQHDGK